MKVFISVVDDYDYYSGGCVVVAAKDLDELENVLRNSHWCKVINGESVLLLTRSGIHHTMTPFRELKGVYARGDARILIDEVCLSDE